jgi:hypothetical protein
MKATQHDDNVEGKLAVGAGAAAVLAFFSDGIVIDNLGKRLVVTILSIVA